MSALVLIAAAIPLGLLLRSAKAPPRIWPTVRAEDRRRVYESRRGPELDPDIAHRQARGYRVIASLLATRPEYRYRPPERRAVTTGPRRRRAPYPLTRKEDGHGH